MKISSDMFSKGARTTEGLGRPLSHDPYLFIVGCARSGTTLLKRIVDAHPQIAITTEMHWMVSFRKKKALTSQRVSQELLSGLVEHKRFSLLEIHREEFKKLVGADETLSYAEFLIRTFDLYRRVKRKPLVGSKTPVYVKRINNLHYLFPTARIVHLIRDGRDVCLSVMNWRKGAKIIGRYSAKDRVSAIALWWKQKVQRGREAGSSLGPELYYELRYEDLMADPEKACQALCQFLALPFSEAMLNFHKGRTRTEPGLSAKDAWLPITPGLRDWRRQMSAQDVERFEAVAGDLLEEIGYPLSVPRSKPVSHIDTPLRYNSRNPYLLIAGCARSGTTLLQRMLDHHPLLAVANEARFLLRVAGNGAEPTDPPLTPDLVEWVRRYHRFPKLGLSETAVNKAAAISRTFGEFVSTLYSEYGKLYGKTLAGEKTPRYIEFLPRLQALFPWVKIIHIIRDGRDVALSALQWAARKDPNKEKGPGKCQFWNEEPVAACALWWSRRVGTARLDGAGLAHGSYHEVLYEDLVNRSEKTLRQVTEFLEVPFAEEMLAYHVGKACYGSKRSAKSAWLPPTPGLRDWRTQMNARDVELFEAIAGDLLSALGYERAFNSISSEISRVAEQCCHEWDRELSATRLC